jgi:hypothetical protein
VSVGLYFDQNVDRPVADGLHRHAVDVLTTHDGGRAAL